MLCANEGSPPPPRRFVDGLQDAILELVEEEIDLMLVVGGWDSSNTQHLAEISADKGIPTYWINKAKCVQADGSVAHLDPHTMEELRTENFLPAGEIVIGVTSGASTPDAYMQQVRVVRVLVCLFLLSCL